MQSIAPYSQVYGTLQVSTNGFVTTSSTQSWFDNQPLPDARFSGQQLLAPYFDDLAAVSGTSTITYGYTAADFLYVQWNDFALYDNPAARLTFRATFGASSPGWVLFQYIQVTGADGSSATIGIQGATDGVFNQYSHDEAVLPSGTAAAGQSLFAVLFHVDADGDLLPARLETALSSSDGSFDSDLGGVSDLGEFIDGTDPADISDDVPKADADSDGLSDQDESQLGTNPALADSDGDGLADADELSTHGTNPTLADSDGDGSPDGKEIDDGTNALNPAEFRFFEFGVASGSKHKAQSVLDPEGNVHAVAYDNNSGAQLFYYHFKPDGEMLISETAITVQSTRVKSPGIAYADGKVFLSYEDTNSGRLGVVALNPAADDRDGDAANAKTIRLFDRLLEGPSGARHHAVASGPNGIHIVYEIHSDPDSPDGRRASRGAGYVLVGFDGSVLANRVIHLVSQREIDSGWIHKGTGPRVAVGADGIAHVVFYFQGRPRNDAPGAALYYAALEGSELSGPHYLGRAGLERAEISLRGNLLYIGMSGGCAGQSEGVRMGILDVQGYTVSPRSNDLFDVTSAVASGFLLPVTTIWSNGGCHTGAGLAVLESGNAVLYFAADRNSQICLVGASPRGERLGQMRCFFNGSANDNTRNKNLLPLSGDRLGVVFDNRNSDFNYYPIPLSLLFDDTQGGLAGINQSPFISTRPPTAPLGEGQTFTYAAQAGDAETAVAELVWSLASDAPEGSSVSAEGVVTWSIGIGQAGERSFGLKVCDAGMPQRCSTQNIQLSVRQGSPPQVTSTPASTATVGQLYRYQVQASDPEGNVSAYTLIQPSTATLSAAGFFEWTPTSDELGTVAVVIDVADTTGLTGRHSFSVSVLPDSSPLTPGGGGCGCNGSGANGAGLGLLVFLMFGARGLLRRRSQHTDPSASL